MSCHYWCLLGLAVVSTNSPATGFAQTSIPPVAWRYLLVEGSVLMDDCPICGRPTLVYPLRGTFDLIEQTSNPLFTTYSISNINWRTPAYGTGEYVITGQGTFEIGGEVALLQNLRLDLKLNDKPLVFTNENRFVTRNFPLLDAAVQQDEFNLFQYFSLRLVAAPVLEIWFSTLNSFTSGLSSGLSGGPGDVLSHAGRIVKSNAGLVSSLSLMPVVPHLDVDALDIAPGGEVLFSLAEPQFSETRGGLQEGDVLSDQGRVVQRNQDLLAAFQPAPSGIDYGLDALLLRADGEALFSIRSNVFSGKLGLTLKRGDLLSSAGYVVRSQSELMARFHPREAKDNGLDAVYVWPHGEVWFSTEEGFEDAEYGTVQAGDLLSDQGLVIFRNLELMAAFAPQEDLADFGLDALFVVADVTAPAPAPAFLPLAGTNTAALVLSWIGRGRVFQVECAVEVTGPYVPVSPIQLEQTFSDSEFKDRSKSFYRLRQW